MFTEEATKDDLLPQVGFEPVVRCPRVGEFLLKDPSADIRIGIGSTPIVYRDWSSTCLGCRNRGACAKQAERSVAPPLIEEVVCPQSGDTAIPIAEARAMWAGRENPQCDHCSHRPDCLPAA